MQPRPMTETSRPFPSALTRILMLTFAVAGCSLVVFACVICAPPWTDHFTERAQRSGGDRGPGRAGPRGTPRAGRPRAGRSAAESGVNGRDDGVLLAVCGVCAENHQDG